MNAIILGIAESFSNFASGLLLLKVKEDVALRICCAIAIIGNAALMLPMDQTLTYITLFFAIGGLGGIYNTVYLVIEMQVAPTNLARTMQVCFTCGAFGNSLVSIFGSAPQPWPTLFGIIFVIIIYLSSLLLPEGGRFLPRVVKLSDSVTVMDVVPIQATIHESIMMMSNIHTMNFNETFRERAQGAQRPRINESCIDPDLLHFDVNEVSKIMDRWKLDTYDESHVNMTMDDHH